MSKPRDAAAIAQGWSRDSRWQGVERRYTAEDVTRLRGTVHVEHSIARDGAERLWTLLHADEPVRALGALTGGAVLKPGGAADFTVISGDILTLDGADLDAARAEYTVVDGLIVYDRAETP